MGAAGARWLSRTRQCHARRYAYVLLQSPVRPSVEAGRVGWVFYVRSTACDATGGATSAGRARFHLVPG
jgi:hypothetical protein